MEHKTPPLPVLLLAVALLACEGEAGHSRQSYELDPERLAAIEQAYDHVTAKAPERVAREVLRVCDKWRHVDRECVNQEVRIAQLECWIERGRRANRIYMQSANMRPRARDQAILLRQNVCMQHKRWIKRKTGSDF